MFRSSNLVRGALVLTLSLVAGSRCPVRAFEHESTPPTIVANYTYLDHPDANGKPGAILVIECLQGPSCGLPLGVWYDNSRGRWSIYREDRQPMAPGDRFAVHPAGPDGFVAYAKGGRIVLQDERVAGRQDASFRVTPVWNPGGQGGTYNPRDLTVSYGAEGWVVANADGSPMPEGAAVNVRVGPILGAPPSAPEPAPEPAQPAPLLAAPTGLKLAPAVLGKVLAPAGPSKVPPAQPPPGVMIDPAVVAKVPPAKAPPMLAIDPSLAHGNVLCVDQLNGSFEAGLTCWTATGDAFTGQPVQGTTIEAGRVRTEMAYGNGGIGGDYWSDLPYPIGVKGEAWIGTYEAVPGRGRGDGPTGTLTSTAFRLRGRYISFLMGGGADPARLHVSLWMKRTDLEAAGVAKLAKFGTPEPDGFVEVGRIANPAHGEELERRAFDLDALLGAGPRARLPPGVLAKLRIVDQSPSAWGHLNVDDFTMGDADPAAGTVQVSRAGRTWTFDADKPVWGFADTHSHPAQHLGFGGKLIAGDSALPLDQTYADRVCEESHGGIIHSMGGKSYHHLAITVADDHFEKGAPDYIGFPRFNVKLHAKHHREWFRRAWQGGQRLVAALAVNNQYLATRALGVGIRPGTRVDDHTQMRVQADFMKQLVASGSDFMEVAYSPADARRIIHQGKLAVVLGIEIDNFGNFKDESFIWRDDPSHSAPLQVLSRDPAVARTQLEPVIREYKDMGYRQFTPVHYVNGVFGGVPVFMFEPLIINAGYTNRYPRVAEGRGRGVALNILDDTSVLKSLVMGGSDRSHQQLLEMIAAANRESPGADRMVGTINADGLTPRGRELFLGLMREGLLVDSEHLGMATKDDLFALARAYDYPLMSSHSDVADLGFRSGPTTTWRDKQPVDRWGAFGTSNIRNLAHEGQLAAPHMDAIRDSGGTVGVIMLSYKKKPYEGSWGVEGERGRIRNDCDGSSKTWAQTYLAAAERMQGRGVALSTDQGGTEFIAPRFGPYAAWKMRDEEHDPAKGPWRDAQRRAQAAPRPGTRNDKGVRYDRRIESFHSWLNEFGVDHDLQEEDAWKALGYIAAFPGVIPGTPEYQGLPGEGGPINRPFKVPASSQTGHWGRIENYVKGWYCPTEAQLDHRAWGDLVTESSFEQAVFWLLRHDKTPCDLRTYHENDVRHCGNGYADGAGAISRLYAKLKPVYDIWRNMEGDNAPLRRLVTGNRSWDVNLDGVAHYGMLPDFLQDLRNVGMSATQMSALFRSAEDYIRMWEKAESAASRVQR